MKEIARRKQLISVPNHSLVMDQVGCITGEAFFKATSLTLVPSVHIHMTVAAHFATIIEVATHTALEESTGNRMATVT